VERQKFIENWYNLAKISNFVRRYCERLIYFIVPVERKREERLYEKTILENRFRASLNYSKHQKSLNNLSSRN